MEAREFEAFVRAQDPVSVAAVDWHTRRDEGLTAEQETELEQWLAANPAHRIAFARVDESVRVLRGLPPEEVAHLRQEHRPSGDPASHPSDQDSASEHRQPTIKERELHSRPRTARGHRFFDALSVRIGAVALCCAAVAAVVVGWDQWREQPVFASSYAVQRGQRLDVPLPDGSRLALDTDTDVDVALYRNRREVRLKHGQAMFSVSPDASRPLEVLSGPARVTVVGTKFSVRYLGAGSDLGQVRVAVEEGHVRVADSTPERREDGVSGAVDLTAGQEVQVSQSGVLSAVSAVAAGGIAPWRTGLIHFSNTPLSEALRELERYGPSHLVIRDPDVAALPIAGSYQIARPEAFAHILPKILPVRLVVREDGTTEIVRAR
ncbi:MAG: FecR domain-containing protein [Burkholderiaceae bacterium]